MQASKLLDKCEEILGVKLLELLQDALHESRRG